ncbi:MAG TPA: hypothetical protein VF774_13430, partial [Pseudoduganella sp.]
HQIDAAGWFVANPQVTVVDTRRFQRMDKALTAFLDEMAAHPPQDPATRRALDALGAALAQPQGVDY